MLLVGTTETYLYIYTYILTFKDAYNYISLLNSIGADYQKSSFKTSIWYNKYSPNCKKGLDLKIVLKLF